MSRVGSPAAERLEGSQGKLAERWGEASRLGRSQDGATGRETGQEPAWSADLGACPSAFPCLCPSSHAFIHPSTHLSICLTASSSSQAATSFIHLFHKYLLSTYYVSHTMLGLGHWNRHSPRPPKADILVGDMAITSKQTAKYIITSWAKTLGKITRLLPVCPSGWPSICQCSSLSLRFSFSPANSLGQGSCFSRSFLPEPSFTLASTGADF